MFSNHLIEYAEERYEERLELLGMWRERVAGRMAQCGMEEQVLMKFLYGTMPLRDAGEYEFDVFLGFVKHALVLREKMEWCKGIPEDIFLHYVLYDRVNSEKIEDCREFFYRQLRERIEGMSVEEAVLEVNYWCAEAASYEASDNRTSSPMTVYRSGRGRCGEESVLAVTALRSVGIPARQVYTPRWAHCDDNHAWVEAYVDGKWRFLGACEPEEILDKGWFTNASSRAVIVHTMTFSDYSCGFMEEQIGTGRMPVYYNDTANYALVKDYVVRVEDESGRPVPGVTVSVEILNMAEYCNVLTLITDERGMARMTVGLGDVHIHAMKDDVYVEAIASVKDSGELVLEFPSKEVGEAEHAPIHWREVDIEAPVDYPMHPVVLTKEQKRTNAARLKLAGERRESRLESYYIEEKASVYPEEQELLHKAKGNFEEIYRFLSKDGNPNRRKLLHTLSDKDYKDAKADILEDHLTGSGDGAGVEESLFVSCILCPRIYLEELTAYRSFINEYFTEEQKVEFRSNPSRIWAYIRKEIQYALDLDYDTICSTPVGCLRLKQGNPLSQKLLFAAICRTLMIPARLNPVTLEAEYHDGSKFIVVSGTKNCEMTYQEPESQEPESQNPENQEPESQNPENQNPENQSSGHLTLTVQDGSKWKYYQTWTIGVLQNAQFTTLDYTDIKFDNNFLTLHLNPGTYRVITTSRMPNGSQHAMEATFTIHSGSCYELPMTLREGSLSDMLVSNEIAEFELTAPDNAPVSVTELTGDHANILLFLEEGKEPTEHVLNEMLDHREELCALHDLNARIICVIKDSSALSNATFAKTLATIPGIQVYYDDFTDHVETLARRMYVDPEKMPLLVVTRPGMTGIYACSGYNVGSVDLIVKILGGTGGNQGSKEQ